MSTNKTNKLIKKIKVKEIAIVADNTEIIFSNEPQVVRELRLLKITSIS